MTSNDRRLARKATYAPLQITARLRCGVISDGLLPIDSVLYFAAHRQTLGLQTRSATWSRALTPRPEASAPILLPLQRLAGDTPHWFHAASCAIWPEQVAEGTDYWTKRIDSRYIELMRPLTHRVPTSGGIYRAYHMPVVYRHALSLTWYVVGAIEPIRDLLHLVTHLGKKASMGWGAVIDWTVTPSPEDWSVYGPSGRLQRPVPDAAGTLYGVRPPYWLPRHQVPCRLPTIA